MTTTKSTLIISLIVGLCAGIGLLLLAHISGETISPGSFTQDAIIILGGTIIAFFCAAFLLIKLLYRTSIKRKLLLVPIICLLALGYYAFETGAYYTWYRTLLVADNPYDGVYTFDPAKITSDHIKHSVERGQQLDAQPLTLTIDQNWATLYGYQWNAPAISRLFNVCFQGDVMLLVNGDWADNYCELEEKDKLILSFQADGDGRLVCSNCEEALFPSHWIYAGELPPFSP